jgi:putative transposase
MNSNKTPQQHPPRRSPRLPGYDYSQNGAYFVTICTHEHQSRLGTISGGVMSLNSKGDIVESCLKEITAHFSNLELPVYVVMPNHLHCIMIIKDSRERQLGSLSNNEVVSYTIPFIESFGKPGCSTLPTIIRSLKSAVTNRVNKVRENKKTPFWQRGYYEHVIRSEEEMDRIGNYILGNPAKWETDRENPYPFKREKPLSFEYWRVIRLARHAVPLQAVILLGTLNSWESRFHSN